MGRFALGVMLAVLNASALAQSGLVELSASQPRSFVLPPNSFTTQLYFDLPAGVSRFRLELEGSAQSGDLDLFLRQGQQFISTNTYGKNLNIEELAEYAQYWSVSAQSSEAILVTAASLRPPVAGRYFISVFNGENRDGTATLRLVLNPPVTPIQFDVRFDLACDPSDSACKCDLAPWNDPSTSGFAAPGNPGITLGQKRRNAMLAAAQAVANQLQGEGKVVVRACWADLDSGELTTLAQAGPDNSAINDPTLSIRTASGAIRRILPTPFLPRYTWFAAAPAGQAIGSSSCQALGGDCANFADLTITFNALIDTPQALGNRSFFYGTSATNPGQNVDFLTVAMHELVHGLGYVDLLSEDGAELQDRDDAFSRYLINAAQQNPRSLARLSNAERKAATISENLQWVGPETLQRSSALVQTGDSGIRMYAPTQLSVGSNVSHLDQLRFANELMAPFYSITRNLGIALGQLYDLGWSNAPRSAPAVSTFYPGNWFDPTRSGHGFDIEPAGKLNGFDRLLVTSYTYDAQGLPEYFISVGQLVDGVFLADSTRSNTGVLSSLGRYRFLNGASQLVPDFSGRLRLDFNQAKNSAACTAEGRAQAPEEAATMAFIAGNDAVTWCLQSLIPKVQRPTPDFTGHWYDATDPGWGMGLANAVLNGKIVLLAIIYYPDGAGNFRWAYAQSNDFQSGQTIPIFQRNGYCRSCARTEPVDIAAGSLTITLDQVEGMSGQNNKVSFDVTFQGPGGGGIRRTNAALVRLVERPRDLQ